MTHSKYLMLTDNGYDATSVHYYDSKEELTGALRSPKELLDMRGEKQ